MIKCLLGLLLVSHHLELVNLLQLGDLEGSVGLAGLHLQVVDLHVPLLDGILHVELLAKDVAALVVELLDKGGQVVLSTCRSKYELCRRLEMQVNILSFNLQAILGWKYFRHQNCGSLSSSVLPRLTLLMAETSGSSPHLALTSSGTTMMTGGCERCGGVEGWGGPVTLASGGAGTPGSARTGSQAGPLCGGRGK